MIAGLHNRPSGSHQCLVGLSLGGLRGNDLLASRDDGRILVVSTESTAGQDAVAVTHAAAGCRRVGGRVRAVKQTTAACGGAFGGDGLGVVSRRGGRGGGGSIGGVAAKERHRVT